MFDNSFRRLLAPDSPLVKIEKRQLFASLQSMRLESWRWIFETRLMTGGEAHFAASSDVNERCINESHRSRADIAHNQL
jgi:hypothetical protein